MTARPTLLLVIAALVSACDPGPPTAVSASPVTSAAPSATAVPPTGAATPSPASSAPAGPAEWSTYHGDAARTGTSSEVASFTSVDVAWQTDVLTGDIYAAPIVVNGSAIVATERNVVYAFDARTGQPRWRAALGTPVDATTLPCGNIRPVTGITGTPVADARAGLVYVVAFEQTYHHELYALEVATGAIRFHRTVDPPGADPKVHQQRAALALANGRVYVAYGGLAGDCGAYRGSVVGVSAASGDGELLSYRVPANREAGIWAPSGIAVDANGRLFVVTGNSDSNGRYDYNDAVLRLSPDLALEDYWAPADWLSLSRTDTDIGSVGPTLLPDGRVIEAGKNGVLYLLNASSLGGIGGELARLKVCGSIFGGFAYASGVAYTPCSDGLAAVQISGTALRTLWRGPRGTNGPPIVAGGAAWVTAYDAGVVYALDLASGATRFQRTVGPMQHFTTLTAFGDEILVAAGGRLIALRMR
ncbi:MAG TPA: PQQ-binding-like beta-propeller repeat protein [Candidatus Limnocylindria bacterium]|nr:PQQ-binding-like beta-propeller repeat protein [Candidatus Limnocylindria bacterium]